LEVKVNIKNFLNYGKYIKEVIKLTGKSVVKPYHRRHRNVTGKNFRNKDEGNA
jgi:hypothetical protein